MSSPPSPSMPKLIALNIPPELVLPTPSKDQEQLVKLVTDLVTKKPTTKKEAAEVFQKLQSELSAWLVSELPEQDRKLATAGLTLVSEVVSSGCFGFLKK